MVEWPHERLARLSNPVHVQPRIADIPGSVLREAKAARAFGALIQAVLDGSNGKYDPKVHLAELSARVNQSNEFADYDETVRNVLLALACVEALRRVPTRQMWEFLWSLAWHSASLESFLPEAVIAASAEAGFRDAFFAIARSVVEHAARNPGRRAFPREREIGANLREEWHKHPQLSILWRGNFSRSFHVVGRDDDHVLSIVAEIDPAEFVHLLDTFDYPDPVAHALFWCGAVWRFERWRALVLVAPAAFEEHGGWNGSLVLPLLLSTARDQFQFRVGQNSTDNQVSEATVEIKSLAAEVARSIAPRLDSLECTTRWGNWLVRTAVSSVSSNALPYPSDAKSHGFVEISLVDALINEMPPGRWNEQPAPDVEPWEPWCHLAAGAWIAFSGKAQMPSPAVFFEEWALSPEGWPSHRGQTLRFHAAPFDGMPRADGYGARLLALPVVEAENADTGWKRFWDSTTTLREIVEFGDSDEAISGGWRGRREASNLLMLQFSIGLMMIDHLILPQRPLVYDRLSAIEGLLPLLGEAVREMTAIDQLNGKFWSEAMRHLAIRRAAWLSGSGAQSTGAGVVLGPEVKPTLADFISDLAGDTENLLALVYVALRNGLEKTAVVNAFKEAGVDLRAEIGIAERLLAISPRAIGLTEAQVDEARGLLINEPT